MSTVDLNGRTITDSVVKDVLNNMAAYFGATLHVTSGNRSTVPEGGSPTSLHLSGKAADFKIDGLDFGNIYQNLRNLGASQVFVKGHIYEFIWHGNHTTTTGAHLHIGRIGANSNGYVKFIMEGVTPDGAGKYPLDLQVPLTGSNTVGNSYLGQ